MSTFIDRSRENWTGEPNMEHINAGSLQRIADATEKMAANYIAMENAKRSAEASRDYWRNEAEHKDRQRRSLRGYITRLKRRIKP